MDMYQKRKMRAENKSNNQEEKQNKVGINWVMLFYGNTSKNVDISNFL